jgi:ribosomal-protein-alanine N-acetyltransferase
MALLDWTRIDPMYRLSGDGVLLRPPQTSDFQAWRDLRAASRDDLQPWEPVWPVDDLTRIGFRRRMSAYQRDLDLGLGYAFFVFRKSDEALVGGVALSNVRRGIAQTASLGYWAGKPYLRRGHTLAGVRAVLAFAQKPLGLHRIEAACLPTNIASGGLLIKAGFKEEGYAPAYLKINGEWRDHSLFGLILGAAIKQGHLLPSRVLS